MSWQYTKQKCGFPLTRALCWSLKCSIHVVINDHGFSKHCGRWTASDIFCGKYCIALVKRCLKHMKPTRSCMYRDRRIHPSPPSAAYMRQRTGSALVQIMARRLFGSKPLSKPMLGCYRMDHKKKLQWILITMQNFIRENVTENIFCEIAVIFSRGRWVNHIIMLWDMRDGIELTSMMVVHVVHAIIKMLRKENWDIWMQYFWLAIISYACFRSSIGCLMM